MIIIIIIIVIIIIIIIVIIIIIIIMMSCACTCVGDILIGTCFVVGISLSVWAQSLLVQLLLSSLLLYSYYHCYCYEYYYISRNTMMSLTKIYKLSQIMHPFNLFSTGESGKLPRN